MLHRLAVSLVVLFLAAGCGSSGKPSGGSPGFYDGPAFVVAMNKAYATYTWPSDRRPDLQKLIDQNKPGTGQKRQAGAERMVLGIINTCAWYLSWNDARQRGDAPAVDKALAVMTNVIPGYTAGSPDNQQYVIDAARKASLGDSTKALNYVSANCDSSTVRWLPA
ncbi:putative secreted protein [Candidatus Protofrankia californiensis]|uniref:Putative secreted protein n=1 Tax=Candidatus Protofrankia californiensis TaxID=1839754 RepID=A0A1C3PE51_9ACTN|nr:putative secreted protein [Candidatus Protofrankia californiensis]